MRGSEGGSRVRSSLHLSPLSPLKVKGGRRRRRRKGRGKWSHVCMARFPVIYFFSVCLICFKHIEDFACTSVE